ncbi:hypothetical protein FRB91_000267 [Serendipita sp. 411]|nr:hypothetical protein FRC18_011676 [Serendipita sp. 400]KAG8847015.1 hypothetical protein FRB91_000267 [Serendipita sp. 411]
MSALIPSVRLNVRPTLQKSYFTSELFVNAARSDIDNLLSTFDLHVEGQPQPYAEFKHVWVKEGWSLVHLYIWDDSARDEYFRTLFRLFLERINQDEEEVLQIGALFGLYTLYETQAHIQSLHRLEHISIPIDTLQHLHTLSEACENPEFTPYILYILNNFLSNDVFHIIPDSTLHPYAPTVLPRSFIIRKDEEDMTLENQRHEGNPDSEEVATTTTATTRYTRGGITKSDRDRTGRAKWASLNDWVDEIAPKLGMQDMGGGGGRDGAREEYETTKKDVLDVLPVSVEELAEKNALDRLKALLHPSFSPTTIAQTAVVVPSNSAEENTGNVSTSRTGIMSPSEGIDTFERVMRKTGAGVLRDQWEDTANT